MKETAINRIRELVGNENVIQYAPEMLKYLKGNGKPLAVVLPGNTSQVSGVVKLANEMNLKIAVGGNIVDIKGMDGCLALGLGRMNKILEIDRENLVAIVEPGLSHKEFRQKVSEAGLDFPPEPFNSFTSSLGGCFAIGGADSKSFNFGTPRTYILGWEMVLPTGEILYVGNKCIKNVSGYDLIHFMVGSQGTLGIFTKLLIKLLPKPASRQTVLASFASPQKACSVFTTLIARGIYPTRLNLLNWPLAQNIVAGKPGLNVSSDYLAMVDLEGFKESTRQLSEEIAGVFNLYGASDVQIIKDCEQYESIWDSWLEVKAGLNSGDSTGVDFFVGPANIGKALKGLEDITGDLANCPGLIVYGFTGNIRLIPNNITAQSLESLLDKINNLAMSLGGNISHSLGRKLLCKAKNDMEMYNEIMNLGNRLRTQFDPKGILAPGVSLWN
ncbi:MAG: FAD-binding oxidoreductase [Clostridia bacterium]|nr:FAD-binding oxidoreductase [Clostridia bacterium]